MKDPRNPFRLRQSESIDNDIVFLNLFEPGVLELLNPQTWCQSVRPIRSAAGGGKTSLLRLFTPSVLHTLYARPNDERLKELTQRLRDLGALSDDGPDVLGVMLLCGRNYALLQDLDIDEARRNRIFFGLLNVRIVLAVLRAAMSFRQLRYPTDLQRLSVAELSGIAAPPGLHLPCTGEDLYKWAADSEGRICQTLDSFAPLQDVSLPGHDTLFSLPLVRPEAICIDGKPVAARILLMLDDIHKLTKAQRSLLVETIIELRSSTAVWIAERFEALSTEEMLAEGASEGREYEQALLIEPYWRKHYKSFERHVVRIADRRIQEAHSEHPLGDFRPFLRDSLDGPQWEDRFRHAAAMVQERVDKSAHGSKTFQGWIEATRGQRSTSRDQALAWRGLEILMARHKNRRQRSLFDDDAIPTEELQRQRDSSVEQAAELFLAQEFGFPYYFGADRLCRLGSLNIQQFLGLAGDVFEDVISAPLAKEALELSPERQHELMKKAAKRLWDEIPNRVRHGRELRRFLEAVAQFSKWYTYRPTAPNDPGVTGTAMRMTERAQLITGEVFKTIPESRRLADVLASALAHNLLIGEPDYKVKGDQWMVLYLNRLLCVHFDLPLGYGLFKERPLKTLVEWLDRPFTAPEKEEGLL